MSVNAITTITFYNVKNDLRDKIKELIEMKVNTLYNDIEKIYYLENVKFDINKDENNHFCYEEDDDNDDYYYISFKIDAPINWSYHNFYKMFDFIIELQLCQQIIFKYVPDQSNDIELYISEYFNGLYECTYNDAPGVCHFRKNLFYEDIFEELENEDDWDHENYEDFTDYASDNEEKIINDKIEYWVNEYLNEERDEFDVVSGN